jgi:hypothetical protein
MTRGIYHIIWILFVLALPSLSHAYVGPGTGLSAIGSIVAFLGAILLMIIGFLWYPIKRLLKGKMFGSFREMGREGGEEGGEPESSDKESKET